MELGQAAWLQGWRPGGAGGHPGIHRSAALLQGVESVKKEIDQSVLGQTGPYRKPERLRKRTEFAGEKFKEEKVFEPNE